MNIYNIILVNIYEINWIIVIIIGILLSYNRKIINTNDFCIILCKSICLTSADYVLNINVLLNE